jgi:hypothetical protein
VAQASGAAARAAEVVAQLSARASLVR